MKKLLFLILLTIIFISCDGRNRKHKTNRAILIENKLLDSFSQRVTYFPESYTEISTDTILSNGFKVKIKSYTDMQNNVLNEFEEGSIHFKHYYREYNTDIEIVKNEKVIFSDTINKSFLIQKLKETHSDFESYSLINFYLDEELSALKNNVVICAMYNTPKSKTYKTFNFNFFEDKTYSIKEVI